MIRLVCASICAIILWPNIINAETIKVRTGDHGSFTRLVFYLETSRDIDISESPQGYEVRNSSLQTKYDLKDVYRTIGRNRLSNIWQDGSTKVLNLEIDCSCRIEKFRHLEKIIVVDIHDSSEFVSKKNELQFRNEEKNHQD